MEPDKAVDTSSASPEAAPDFYLEHGNVVFTASFLKRRGTCCGSGCRHCPYGDARRQAPEAIDDKM